MKKHKSKRTILKNYYVNNYDQLCQDIRRRGVNPSDIEDVVQEAFTKALTFLETYEEEREFGTWFYTILNNCHKDYVRQEILKGQTKDDFDEDNFPIMSPDIEVDYLQIKRIKEDIDAKPEPLSTVLRLYFVYNYAPLDISYLVDGLARKTIRNYISDFKTEMREKYVERS